MLKTFGGYVIARNGAVAAELAKQGLASVTLDGKISHPGSLQVKPLWPCLPSPSLQGCSVALAPQGHMHCCTSSHVVQPWLAMTGAELARQGLGSITLDSEVSIPGALQVVMTLSCMCAGLPSRPVHMLTCCTLHLYGDLHSCEPPWMETAWLVSTRISGSSQLARRTI